MDSQQASEIVQAYLRVHLDLPTGLKDEALLPHPKARIAEALRYGLSREERSSIDDELMRSIYVGLSEYQPDVVSLLERMAGEERARLREDLTRYREKPIPEEFRRKLLEMFPPREGQPA